MQMQPRPKPKTPCMDAALKLLGGKAFSQHELGQKLIEKGYEQGEMAAVLQRLAELNYLDDAAYAKGRVRYRVEVSKWGPTRIRQELVQKGVAKTHIEAALEHYEQHHSSAQNEENLWQEQANQLLAKKFAKEVELLEGQPQKNTIPYLKTRQKLVARMQGFLLRKGLPAGVVNRAVETLFKR